MELPKYHETFIPILEVLGTVESLHHRELRNRIRNKYYSNLPQELLDQQTSTWANTLSDRIGWGMYTLKMAKLVQQPSKGIFQITEKGKKILSKGVFTLKDLKEDLDYIAHEQARKEEKKENKVEEISVDNASPQDLIDSGFSIIEAQI